MKPITLLLAAGSLLLSAQGLSAQTDGSGKKEYWNANTLLIPYRLPPAPAGYKPTYIDLDGDGDPDILRTVTANGSMTTTICSTAIWRAIPITTA